MSRFFYAHEIAKPEDVIPYLARQGHHWKKGRSAYELAHSWVNAADIPASVRSVLNTCPDYAGATLVEGLFERDVDLRTRGHRSQTADGWSQGVIRDLETKQFHCGFCGVIVA